MREAPESKLRDPEFAGLMLLRSKLPDEAGGGNVYAPVLAGGVGTGYGGSGYEGAFEGCRPTGVVLCGLGMGAPFLSPFCAAVDRVRRRASPD